MNAVASTGGEDSTGSRVDPRQACLQTARSVIQHEVDALLLMLDRLDDRFLRVVEWIGAAEGRVVVTGLGKSGLVGRKIVATLASTGTPSFFVHAAEALHGDAGMVLTTDLLIAISKSGETHEVVRFATMAHERGTRVIALTGSTDSTLAKLADETLEVRVEREADPFDLAPTASTTATMVMGDALSIALMALRGGNAEDFFLNHPGGSLEATWRQARADEGPAVGLDS